MARPLLVTGRTGQVGGALANQGQRLAVLAVGRPEFDFDRPETITDLFTSLAPRSVVNAAAVLAILCRIERSGWQEWYRGILQVAGSGETTSHGLATAVFEPAACRGLVPSEIAPIATAE